MVSTNKKVNADATSAFIEYEFNGINQITFIVYVLDAYQDITTSNCGLEIYNSDNDYTFYSIASSINF